MDTKITNISNGISPNELPPENPVDTRDAKVQYNDERCQILWSNVKERFDKCFQELIRKERQE